MNGVQDKTRRVGEGARQPQARGDGQAAQQTPPSRRFRRVKFGLIAYNID